jgi:hypothetical protein
MFRILLSLTFSILLAACASPLPQKPKALNDAEQNMQRGATAYANDEYHLAANAFTNALDLYQSIDDGPGIFEASVNLIETSITVGNLAAARQRLQRLKGVTDESSGMDGAMRLKLLEVRLLHAEQRPQQALDLLRPLWPEFDEGQRIIQGGEHSLAVIAASARLKQQLGHTDADLWIRRFATIDLDTTPGDQRYRALLLRLQAQQLNDASPGSSEGERLLREALGIYRNLVYRRGIAAALQQLAQLRLQRHELGVADNLYQRALKIHLWTLNRGAAAEVLEALVDINRQLGDQADVALFSAQLEKLQQDKR